MSTPTSTYDVSSRNNEPDRMEFDDKKRGNPLIFNKRTPNGMILFACFDRDSPSYQKAERDRARTITEAGRRHFENRVWSLMPPRSLLFRDCQSYYPDAHAHHRYCINLAIFFLHDVKESDVDECFEFVGALRARTAQDLQWMMDRRYQVQRYMIDVVVEMVHAVFHYTGGLSYWEEHTNFDHRGEVFEFFFDLQPLPICLYVFGSLRDYVEFEHIWSVSKDTPHIKFIRWFCKHQILDLCHAVYEHVIRRGVRESVGQKVVEDVWTSSPSRLLDVWKQEDDTKYPYSWKDLPTGRFGSVGEMNRHDPHQYQEPYGMSDEDEDGTEVEVTASGSVGAKRKLELDIETLESQLYQMRHHEGTHQRERNIEIFERHLAMIREQAAVLEKKFPTSNRNSPDSPRTQSGSPIDRTITKSISGPEGDETDTE